MAPVRRLGTLSKSKLGARPKPAPPPFTTTTTTTRHNCCDDPQVEDDGEGHMVCKNCFTQISESNIVAEVTFQEDSRGAATVQGGTINENARHARTLGSATWRRVGGGESNSQHEREANGRRALAALCPKLGVPETISNQALSLYTLASTNNFSAGRRTEEVIAACLYAACRRQRDNTVLLIDISEMIHMNVFRLGEVYKDLCEKLYLPEGGSAVGTQHLVEVESLIMKYCRKLEFGEMTRQVAEDATRIVRRMKRDWMVTGRHPAGLCGASIILAARMNNFRRTVRETVYVAKVADVTIAKRVEEFRRLKSATLTVDQFRDIGNRLKHQADPPILYETELRKEKFETKKRKRQEASEARDLIEISDDGSDTSSRQTSLAAGTPVQEQNGVENGRSKRRRTSRTQLETPDPTQEEPRRDADGFVIPPRPIAPALNGEQESDGRKRGRSKKLPPEPVIITEEELIAEEELEKEIDDVLNDEAILDSRTEIEKAKGEQQAKELADHEKRSEAEKEKSRRESEGITWWTDNEANHREIATAEELEAEFADDPEVTNCLLPEAEQKVKEMIWVKHNEDWMRAQQEKQLIATVAQAAGRDQKAKKGTKGVKRKRKGKMGDGTTLAEATNPIETPADATQAMLEARAPANFSRYINYEVLQRVYQRTPSTTTSRSGSQVPEPTTGGASRDATPADARESASPSASPTPSAGRLQTPPVTQQMAGASSSPTASRHRPTDPQAPPSPQQTQDQATEGAQEEESEGDEDDYIAEDALDYGSDVGSGDGGSPPAWGSYEDDREDIGEEDYQRAVHPENRLEQYYDEGDFV